MYGIKLDISVNHTIRKFVQFNVLNLEYKYQRDEIESFLQYLISHGICMKKTLKKYVHCFQLDKLNSS